MVTQNDYEKLVRGLYESNRKLEIGNNVDDILMKISFVIAILFAISFFSALMSSVVFLFF